MKPNLFFDQIQATFKKACLKSKSKEFLTLGNQTIALEFAGSDMPGVVLPALSHLKSSGPESTSITFHIWDSESTQTKLPPPPWKNEDYRARGEIHGFSNDNIRISFHPASDTLSAYDKNRKVGYFWVQSIKKYPFWEKGSPLRSLFHWALSEEGFQFIHAGAIGTKEGGVLFVGKGGSGKSTLSLTSFDSPLLFASDDFCLVSTSPTPKAYGLYSSAKQNWNDPFTFPHLEKCRANSKNSQDEKALYLFNNHLKHKIIAEFPIKAILVPQIKNENTFQLTPLSGAKAAAALIPSTLFYLPYADEDDFKRMTELAKSLPCYSLEIGPNINKVPQQIFDFLSEKLVLST